MRQGAGMTLFQPSPGSKGSDGTAAPPPYPQTQYPRDPRAQHPQAEWAPPQAVQAQPPQPPRPRADRREAPHPLGIDPATWPIIRDSAARLSRNEDAFIRQLHNDITGLTEGPAGARAPDLWVFTERMVRSLLWVALTDQSLGVVADILRKVGAQNWIEGCSDALYGDVTHAIAQTVHLLCADEGSASTASAWITYFMWVRPHLLAGAQQAAEQHAAVQQ